MNKDMTLKEYNDYTSSTVSYPSEDPLFSLLYVTLGLTGESGEVAEEVKRVLRDDASNITHERREKIINELGDALWYLTRAANEIGSSLEEVAERNVNKLNSRLERGKIKGHGDDR